MDRLHRYQQSWQLPVRDSLTWRERLSEVALWSLGFGWLGFVAFLMLGCAGTPANGNVSVMQKAGAVIVADTKQAGQAATLLIREICPFLPVLSGTLGVIATQRPDAADLQKATQMLMANQGLLSAICAIAIPVTAPVTIVQPGPAGQPSPITVLPPQPVADPPLKGVVGTIAIPPVPEVVPNAMVHQP